jgi:hypothetical protein
MPLRDAPRARTNPRLRFGFSRDTALALRPKTLHLADSMRRCGSTQHRQRRMSAERLELSCVVPSAARATSASTSELCRSQVESDQVAREPPPSLSRAPGFSTALGAQVFARCVPGGGAEASARSSDVSDALSLARSQRFQSGWRMTMTRTRSPGVSGNGSASFRAPCSYLASMGRTQEP